MVWNVDVVHAQPEARWVMVGTARLEQEPYRAPRSAMAGFSRKLGSAPGDGADLPATWSEILRSYLDKPNFSIRYRIWSRLRPSSFAALVWFQSVRSSA